MGDNSDAHVPEALSSAPACYLIVHNVSKRHNIGTLARCATAFGVTEVCLVGSRQFTTFGSHGAANHVAFRHFTSLDDCCTTLRQDHGCEIIGIEIMENAKAVTTHPFRGPTAFMLGNEGAGLSDKQIRMCDSFVYIPQHGAGTASLNVSVAASIVLHHFAAWAGYPERARTGQKFIVDDRPERTGPRGVVPLSELELQQEQARRRLLAKQDWLMEDELPDADAEGGGFLGNFLNKDDDCQL